MTRNQFLRGFLGMLGVGALGSACAGDDQSSDGGGACGSVDTDIEGNHGHTLTIPGADVAAGEAKTYMLTASNGHSHEVTVSAPKMEDLAMGGSASVVTSNDGGHQHTVTLMC